MGRPDVPGPRQEPARWPGTNNRMLAITAMSTLRAIPDPLVTESMPRPLLEPAQIRAGTVRSPGPARRQQLFRDFSASTAFSAGGAVDGMIRRASQEAAPVDRGRPHARDGAATGGGQVRRSRRQESTATGRYARPQPGMHGRSQARPPASTHGHRQVRPLAGTHGHRQVQPLAGTHGRSQAWPRAGAHLFLLPLIARPLHRSTDRPP
jgi:hypothetical protein